MDRLESHRQWYARLITAAAGAQAHDRLREAFASIPRERFTGPGPWRVFTRSGYIETPTDDPALLYQDIVVALKSEAQINNGQPSLHAVCLAALGVREGETIVHVGAGTGYYSAILAKLAGPAGRVFAYEIDEALAGRAARNLEGQPGVEVRHRSGVEGALPACDVVYVNAGATGPQPAWIDALRPGGRLMFPLTPSVGGGFMLLVTRTTTGGLAARFVCGVMFTPCIGARDEETGQRLAQAFARGGMGEVRSLRMAATGASPDGTCWLDGRGWWLSTSEAE